VRGAAPGVPGSHAFLVRSPSGTRGYVEIDGARRWIGAETDAGARGASPDVLEPSGVAGRTEASFGPIVAPTIGPERTPDSRERQAFTRPAVAAACGMRTLGQDADEDMLMADGEAVATRSELGAPTLPPNTTRVVEVAVDTDYELFSLIGDVDATIDYLVELYSAISDIYLRETNTRIVLTYVRVWDTPDDLFNEPDPLTPFVNWWNANMQAVPRDVAQLVSGRRNLPWGGVAYLSAACGNFGYSVVGYALGFIPDLSVPNIYDFDVPVCAHELGHNLGALHTHSYGLDNCDQLANTPQRGTIMSYCSQTVSGGNTVTDLRFGTFVAGKIIEFLETAPCLHADCDGDGVADYSQIQANLSLDINRNIRLDGCEDCNGDGVPDAVELDGAWDCWVANQFEDGAVRRMHAQTGVLAGVSEKGVVSMANDLVITPDRRVLVSSGADDRVAELAPDGSFVGDLVGPGVGGLDEPAGLLLKPDGTLLVASRKTHSVLRYSLATGAFLGAFVPAHSGGLVSPFGLAFGPDGHLYVNGADNRVRRYDGATGTFLGILVGSAANGGLGDPRGMVFLPDGRLVVASRATNALLSYDGATGAFLGKFNKGGTTTALTFDEPWGVRIGPNGNLFAVRHRRPAARRPARGPGAARELVAHLRVRHPERHLPSLVRDGTRHAALGADWAGLHARLGDRLQPQRRARRLRHRRGRACRRRPRRHRRRVRRRDCAARRSRRRWRRRRRRSRPAAWRLGNVRAVGTLGRPVRRRSRRQRLGRRRRPRAPARGVELIPSGV
jgi:sugar lactone lactonase YvrE